MAAQHLPEIDGLLDEFGQKMEEHLANLQDFKEAIDAGGTADEIVDDWDSRRLLRQLSLDAQPQ